MHKKQTQETHTSKHNKKTNKVTVKLFKSFLLLTYPPADSMRALWMNQREVISQLKGKQKKTLAWMEEMRCVWSHVDRGINYLRDLVSGFQKVWCDLAASFFTNIDYFEK